MGIRCERILADLASTTYDDPHYVSYVSGAHHPTDVEAGKALADTLYKSLKQEPAFVSGLEGLRPLLR